MKIRRARVALRVELYEKMRAAPFLIGCKYARIWMRLLLLEFLWTFAMRLSGNRPSAFFCDGARRTKAQIAFLADRQLVGKVRRVN
jgi:hypothetical protein